MYVWLKLIDKNVWLKSTSLYSYFGATVTFYFI